MTHPSYSHLMKLTSYIYHCRSTANADEAVKQAHIENIKSGLLTLNKGRYIVYTIMFYI